MSVPSALPNLATVGATCRPCGIKGPKSLPAIIYTNYFHNNRDGLKERASLLVAVAVIVSDDRSLIFHVTVIVAC